jgi:acetyltransferase
MEGIQDGRKFMRVAAPAAKKKPVVVFKVGKTRVGVRAALTHTASLAGEYDHYGAAFRQSGLVEARDLQELVDLSISFSMLPRAAGRTLAIVTNAGGPGAIAADEAQRSGLEVKQLDRAAVARMRGEFGGSGFVSIASFNNPIDLTASASTEEFVKATELALGLDGYDMVLAIPTHQTPSIGYNISARLAEVVARSQKPVCMCVMGRSPLASMIQSDFLARKIPSFATPERAVRALAAAAEYRGLISRARAPASPRVSDMFSGLKAHGVRASYSVIEGLLRAYDITLPRSFVVWTRRDLGKAKKFGFPVACKMLAKGLDHKTESGGVVLNVASTAEAASAFSRFRKTAAKYGARFDGMLVQAMVKDGVELIVGATRDPTFGPVVVFGTGGTYTELVRDFASAIAPVSPREARDMISRTKLSPMLTGFRGGSVVDMPRLTEVVSNFSRILVENPSVDEIEVNPLIATDHGIFAVDARLVLAAADS